MIRPHSEYSSPSSWRQGPRKKLLQLASFGASAALGLAGLSGCSTPSTSSGNGGGETITGYVWSDWKYVFDAAKQFEKDHPGVTVKLNAIPDGNYFNTLPQLFSSSNSPDFSVVPRDGTAFPSYVKAGVLEPLDDVWKSSGLDTNASPTVKGDYTATDGKIYQISAGLTAVPVIYYNKSVFKAAGITAPVSSGPTMDEFYSIAGKLKAAGVDVLGAGLGVQPAAARMFAPYLTNTCGQSWLDGMKQTPATSSWTDACVAQAFSVAKDWASKGVFSGGTGVTTQQETVAESAFVSGKTGMFMDGTWAASQIRKADPNLQFGWFLPPSASGSPMKMTTSSVDGIGISKNSPHKDLAKQFLEYLAKDSGIWQHGFPPRSDISAQGATADPIVVETYEQSSKLGTSSDLNQYVGNDTSTELNNSFLAVILGTKSPEQAAQAVQSKAK